MLPENEFHAAPVPTKTVKITNRREYYTTQEVLERTLMSRFTLIRKVKENKFPKPVSRKDGRLFYSSAEVEKWISSNPDFTSHRKLNADNSIKIDLLKDELNMIKTAAAAMECDPEFFVYEAAIWKAKGVLKRLEYENN